jgi:CheY-like chemotaxis protein
VKRLLVVDPDPRAADALLRRLEGPGLYVRVAAGPAEALERISRQHFDAVVSAMEMEPADGMELVRSLRARGFQTPVMLLSSRKEKQAELDTRLMSWGRALVMSRPVRLHRLTRALELVLTRPLEPCETRAFPRVPIQMAAVLRLEGGAEFAGTTVNLSLGGVSFERAACRVCTGYERGSVHAACPLFRHAQSNTKGRSALVVLQPEGAPPLPLPARVVHTLQMEGTGRELIGLKFVEPSDAERRALEELLEGPLV